MKNIIYKVSTVLFAGLLFANCNNNKKQTSTESEVAQVLDSTYTLTAQLDSLGTTKLRFIKQNFLSQELDTVMVENGKFSITGTFDAPAMAVLLSEDSSKRLRFMLDRGETTLTGSFSNPVITPKTAQDELKKFDDYLASFEKNEKLTEGKSEEEAKAIKDSLSDLYLKRVADYFRTNNDSEISFAIMGNYFKMNMLKAETVNDLFNNFSSNVKNTHAGKKMKAQLDKLMALSVGKKAIDFTQNDVNGKPVTFSNVNKGNYVLIDFWASWCKPCRAENPNVLKAYNAFKDKGFTVLGVSLDSKQENWKKAIKEDGMPWQQLSDLKGGRNEVAEMYSVSAIPTSFLVDPNGVIVAKNLRGEDLMKKLEAIFN